MAKIYTNATINQAFGAKLFHDKPLEVQQLFTKYALAVSLGEMDAKQATELFSAEVADLERTMAPGTTAQTPSAPTSSPTDPAVPPNGLPVN